MKGAIFVALGCLLAGAGAYVIRIARAEGDRDPFMKLSVVTEGDRTTFVWTVDPKTGQKSYFADRKLVLDLAPTGERVLRSAFPVEDGWRWKTVREHVWDPPGWHHTWYEVIRGEQLVYVEVNGRRAQLIEHRSLNSVQLLGLRLARNEFAKSPTSYSGA
jgi:hypothetical protein